MIDWQFIRDVSASASYVKPCVVFGDRDQMPKFGYTNVRVQFAMDTLHWNNTSATFLGSGANRYLKINARIGTNDLYIMDETGTMFMRFNPDSKFRQNSNLAKLISGKAASDGDTTPDVSGTESLLLSNTATTSITRFDGTLSHQIFMVEAQDDNTTLVNGTNLVLANGDNLKLKTGDVVQFKVASNGTTVKQIKVKSHLRSTTSYNPPSLTTLTRVSTNITVTGAELADFVKCSFSIDLQGVILYAYVSAVDTVTVNFFNATTGTIDLGSGTIKILIDK